MEDEEERKVQHLADMLDAVTEPAIDGFEELPDTLKIVMANQQKLFNGLLGIEKALEIVNKNVTKLGRRIHEKSTEGKHVSYKT